MRRYALLSAISFLFAAGHLLAAAPLEATVDAVVKAAGVTETSPGVSVLVVDEGKVVFRKGYGLANLKEKTAIVPETTFELASLSKQFTGVAISILHDQGKLAFDDPVRKYIPELPVTNKVNPIRIRDMLHHVSGLPDYTGWQKPPSRDPRFAVNEDFAKMIHNEPKLVKLQFPTGGKFEYSNTNYLLLGLIVERVSKKSYGSFLHDEIFKPLGMTYSWVYDHAGEAPKHPKLDHLNALGYDKNEKGRWAVSWGAPPFRSETILAVGDGGIWSSIDDMGRWDAGVRGHKLLKPETWKQVWSHSKTRDGKTNEYGFGWFADLDDKGELLGFSHEGSWGGFHTDYGRSVSNDFAVVVLSNRGDLDVCKIHEAIDKFHAKPKRKK